MAEADAAVEFRVVIQHGLEVIQDRTYTLDLDAPNWERFDLTYSEQQRCEKLLSAVRDIWADGDRQSSPEDLSEPVRTLLDAVIDTLGNALARTVESESSLKPSARTG